MPAEHVELVRHEHRLVCMLFPQQIQTLLMPPNNPELLGGPRCARCWCPAVMVVGHMTGVHASKAWVPGKAWAQAGMPVLVIAAADHVQTFT